jgi:glycosyltransferase involved in cell wall biosynthesis
MQIVFIVPCFNAEMNLEFLSNSLLSQKNKNWKCILIDDISNDDTWHKIKEICDKDKTRFEGIKNTEKKYALRNIVEVARKYENNKNTIIAVIDGDDQLCNDDTVDILINEYDKDQDVVWTGHKWDINNLNISKPMPQNVNPYQWPWCSSHLRTFRAQLLKNVCDSNFQDVNKKWFKRGYDQALMLPILSLTSKRKYVDKICYLYNIESVSVNDRDWAEMEQLSTINLVRARGFLS